MPRAKKQTKVTVSKVSTSNKSYFDKLEEEIRSNNSPLSLVLGALIILVVGILIFNYFTQKNKGDINTGQQTQQGDVSPDKLPGKYTVKEGDTLFTIAEKYYKDGYQFTEIAKVNSVGDANAITVGQVLEIPKLAEAVTPSPTASSSPVAEAQPQPSVTPAAEAEVGTGGGDTTVWGPKITGNTYTVVEGDWLSTIAARTYGDVMAYTKIAQANNISNPDLILPGQVLNLPR